MLQIPTPASFGPASVDEVYQYLKKELQSLFTKPQLFKSGEKNLIVTELNTLVKYKSLYHPAGLELCETFLDKWGAIHVTWHDHDDWNKPFEKRVIKIADGELLWAYSDEELRNNIQNRYEAFQSGTQNYRNLMLREDVHSLTWECKRMWIEFRSGETKDMIIKRLERALKQRRINEMYELWSEPCMCGWDNIRFE